MSLLMLAYRAGVCAARARGALVEGLGVSTRRPRPAAAAPRSPARVRNIFRAIALAARSRAGRTRETNGIRWPRDPVARAVAA